MSGSAYEPPSYEPPDILDRIDELAPSTDHVPAAGGIVPSADIWDDDVDDLDDSDEATAGTYADDWLPDAQTVMHGPDGEPYGEPLDDPLYDGRSDPAMASRMAKWGGTSTLGAGLSGFGRAIESVLHTKEYTSIVVEVDATKDSDLEPVTVHLVKDHPEESVAIVRPWLLGKQRRRRRRRVEPDEPNLE